MHTATASLGNSSRLDYMDAVRAFALVLGIVFHACMSFMPVMVGWAVMDISTSPLIGAFVITSHSFRMEVFFLIAGFFAHLTFRKRGALPFLRSRFMRIVIPFVVGWFILRPLIVSGWIMGAMSLSGEVHILHGLREGFASLNTLPKDFLVGSHLWFLYYLTLITGTFLALRGLAGLGGPWQERAAARVDGILARVSCSRFSIPLLAMPTAGVLWFMHGWGMDTPDRSLIPHIPAMLVYGGCFSLGWFLHRTTANLDGFVRLGPWRWIQAILASAACILLVSIQGDPSHPYYAAARLAYTISYALMMWSLAFLTIGVFKKHCRRPNRTIRYLADSSYWMYLIHLPIVVWLQVAVAEIPLHWTIKLFGVSALTILIALVSYDLFVRSSFIGHLLNGRRRDRLFTFAPGAEADRSVRELRKEGRPHTARESGS